MDTITNTPPSPVNDPNPQENPRSRLPAGFDVEAWTRRTCDRSGVTVAVTDPLVLSKLRVLTRRAR